MVPVPVPDMADGDRHLRCENEGLEVVAFYFLRVAFCTQGVFVGRLGLRQSLKGRLQGVFVISSAHQEI